MSEITVPHFEPPYPFEAYAHVVEPLSDEDGCGFLISFPDLPGCMSDGDSIEMAMTNGHDAFSAWMSARAHQGKPIPKPTRHGENAAPVRLMQRLPRSLHANLVARAKGERHYQGLRGHVPLRCLPPTTLHNHAGHQLDLIPRFPESRSPVIALAKSAKSPRLWLLMA